MSTDNNNPTQSINDQLIAVLRPVLHSLPLEVVKAAIPAEAKGSGVDLTSVNKSDVVDTLEKVWNCKLTLDDLFPADYIRDYMDERIDDLGLISHEEAQEHVKEHVPLGDMYSTEELIEHLRESSRAGEIFDSAQLVRLFRMADDQPDMDELYDYEEIKEFIADHGVENFIDDDTLGEYVSENLYLVDLIDEYYGWNDAVEAVSTHVPFDRVAEQYGESDVEEWVKGEYNALSKYDVTEFRRHFSNECITPVQVYSQSDIREFVQEYGITEWYDVDLIRDNYNPSDLFTVAQMLEDLSREFGRLQDRLRHRPANN